jgi:hypothetical protein
MHPAHLSTSPAISLDPRKEVGFLWMQAQMLLEANPSHRPSTVNASLVRIYARIDELS